MLDKTNDLVAMERVLKARTELILSRRFYGVLVSNVEPVLSHKVETMATNGRQHFVNPAFISTLTQTQLLAIQAHESEHDARKHHSRRGSRDPRKWNEATDYSINADLKDQGFDLPDWVLYDPRFRGMSAEDIYRIRELDEKAQQQQQQQDEQDEDEQSEDQQSSGDDQQDIDEAEDGQDAGEQGDDEADGDNQGEGEGQSQDGDEGEDEEGHGAGEGTDGEEGEAEDEGLGEAGKDGQETGQGSGEGQEGEAEGDAQGGAEGQGEGAGEPSDEEGSEASPQSSGDPGRCGEVLDAAEDVADLAETDQKWDRIVRQAAAMAKGIGDLPGHVTREIERDSNPTQDWREVLRQWIDAGSKRIETWNRPNRRLTSQGYILPGTQRDGLNKVCFLVDTSGSMDDEALKCVNVEAQAALDDGAIDEVVVVYGDTEVTRIDEYREGDEIVFDPRGGGGTDMKPLFQYVAEKVDEPSLVICFTDMFWYSEGIPEPECPVLFAVTGYPQEVRELIAKAPWNAAGIDVGAH